MMENMEAIQRTIQILSRTEADSKCKLISEGEDHLLRIASSKPSSDPCTGVPTDSANLLPTDDQLDQLVDNLCDTFPSLGIKFIDNDHQINQTSADPSDRGSLDERAQDQSATSVVDSTISATVLVQPNLSTGSVVVPSQKKKVRTTPGKRATLNTNLNLSMIRCVRHLECLSETRKSLEVHVPWQPHALSSMTRLPHSPTRVDRLIFEVDQERSRVLGLIASSNCAVQAFSATTTKDDLRCMLERFRRAIVDVMKERHCEVDALMGSGAKSDAGNRAIQLALLIDQVTLLIREANTALWCLKQQLRAVKSRNHCMEGTPPQSVITRMAAAEAANGAAQSSAPNAEQQQLAHRSSQMVTQTKINADVGSDEGNEGRPQKKPRGGQRSATALGVPRTNLYPPMSHPASYSSKSKKSSTVQLIAQQQRAEIFQRYASALNGARTDAAIK